MSYLTHPEATFEVVSPVDLQLAREARTTPIYRARTSREVTRLGEMIESIDRCQTVADIQRTVFEALREKLVGWRNVRAVVADGQASEIEFDPARLEDCFDLNEARDLLDEIILAQRLDYLMKKKSASPASSGTAAPAASA